MEMGGEWRALLKRATGGDAHEMRISVRLGPMQRSLFSDKMCHGVDGWCRAFTSVFVFMDRGVNAALGAMTTHL